MSRQNVRDDAKISGDFLNPASTAGYARSSITTILYYREHVRSLAAAIIELLGYGSPICQNLILI